MNGKRAVVTGASRGIGRAVSLELAKAGAEVVLVARSVEGLRETEEQIGSAGGNALTVPCDLNAHGDVDYLVELLRDRGGLDVLVNNAGVLEPLGAFADCEFAVWAHNIAVNVAGTARVTHAVLPMLLAAPEGGTIVTISSGAAVSNIGGWSAYCTSKAALDRFAMVLDAELRDSGVRSFSFAPGTVETDMQQVIRESGVGPARLVQGEIEHLPPDVPAKAVVHLCTPAGAALAGAHIDIRYPEVRQVLGLPSLE